MDHEITLATPSNPPSEATPPEDEAGKEEPEQPAQQAEAGKQKRIKCICALHEWGCRNKVAPNNKGYCSKCTVNTESWLSCYSGVEKCECECTLCTPTVVKATHQEWRCRCVHKGGLRCLWPVKENGYCAHCDPFDHGECICSCCQCLEAQQIGKDAKPSSNKTARKRPLKGT